MNTPLLLLLFNRPEITKKLLIKLKTFKPKKIYINIDGPRKNYKNDIVLIKKVEHSLKIIDWKCKVLKKKNLTNYGCRKSVSQAINWFFQNENKGIILEDDCIPLESFFLFCEKMLSKYKKEKRIKVVSGSNFHKRKVFGNGDYYFSKYAHCWGWATWKRAWSEYEQSMDSWIKFRGTMKWKNFHHNKYENKYWTKIFNRVYRNQIDSWAYVWLFSVWKNQGITITPNTNLVENIGFGPDATTTIRYKNTNNFDNKSIKIKQIKDPKNLIINREADEIIFKTHFNGMYNFWPWRIIYIFKMICSDPITVLLKVKKKLFK